MFLHPNRSKVLSFFLALGTLVSLLTFLDFLYQDEAPERPVSGAVSAQRAKVTFGSPEHLRLSFMGDVMLGSWNHSGKMQPEYFHAVSDFLAHTDFNIINLEGPLVDSSSLSFAKQCTSANCHSFAQLPSTASFLRSSGVHLASFNNNHAFDVANLGIQSTFSHLHQAGIIPLTGSIADTPFITKSSPQKPFNTSDLSQPMPARMTIKNVPLSIITVGTTRGLVRFDDPKVLPLITQESKTHTVIVLGHVGCEGIQAQQMPLDQPESCFGEHRGYVYDFGQKAAAAGARLVVFHGPHVVRPLIQTPSGSLIAYSLGNFATAPGISVTGPTGYAPLLQVELQPNGSLVQCRIVSFIQQRATGLRLDPHRNAFKSIQQLSTPFSNRFPCAED